MTEKTIKNKYYYKRVDFFRLLYKIKLWPSRRGVLHGIKSIVERGQYAEVTTFCNKKFIVKNSRHSRAARWLRNKWVMDACKICKIPSWKVEKYSSTVFTQYYGSHLQNL
ncbi:MAG: pyrrolysine--tRNA(Pyl) ligase small subunit [Desulfitobacterium hafniense]|nr:pyrrolysine--tRNA(Pyl) ligase small subunit [Desulfitobacterium hafniense]